MQPLHASAPLRVARAAAVPVLASPTSSSALRPTSTLSSTPTAPVRPRPARPLAEQPAQKRARPRPGKPKLEGSWWPVLKSRGGKGRGCGHYVFGHPEPSTKIAAFDLDGTVIRPLNGKSFPQSSLDWEFCGPEVVPKLRETYRDGYAVILISNQASPMPNLAADFRKKIPFVCRKIGVPLRVFACWEFDEYRKPAAGMWEALTGRFNGDYAQSFYVGDAAGRPADHADTDRKFALNSGLRSLTPEEFFHGAPPDPNWTLWGWHPHAYDHSLPPPAVQLAPTAVALPPDAPELVLLVGPPTVGKSTYAAQLEREGYLRVTLPPPAGPTALPPPAALEALHAALAQVASTPGAKGVVVDGSLPTRRSRAALRHSLHEASFRAVCAVWTSLSASSSSSTVLGGPDDIADLVELAKHNSVFRLAHAQPAGALTPLPAFTAWGRAYEPPSLSEGFDRLLPRRFAFSPAAAGGAPVEKWQEWLADVYPGKAKKGGRVALRGGEGEVVMVGEGGGAGGV
ncbi:DNA kinase/phosphatase Pnk1 [Rhodotorula kratochvilovae]